MSKTLIGILFILAGLAYGSLANDLVYAKTLGYLIENGWIKPPPFEKVKESQVLGRKTTIIIFSSILIIIGIFILWKLPA